MRGTPLTILLDAHLRRVARRLAQRNAQDLDFARANAIATQRLQVARLTEMDRHRREIERAQQQILRLANAGSQPSSPSYPMDLSMTHPAFRPSPVPPNGQRNCICSRDTQQRSQVRQRDACRARTSSTNRCAPSPVSPTASSDVADRDWRVSIVSEEEGGQAEVAVGSSGLGWEGWDHVVADWDRRREPPWREYHAFAVWM